MATQPKSPAPQADVASDAIRQLREHGYAVIKQAIPTDTIHALDGDLAYPFAQTPFCRGGFYGERTKRFGRLLARSQHAAALVMHPDVLTTANGILGPWCDCLQLNLTQAIALHPGALPQLPHRDQDMWRGAIGETEYLLNVMWPFTPYRELNGTTLVWPDSHGSKALEPIPDTAPIAVEMDPGDALIFLGSTRHGAGGNRSFTIRRGAIVSYCLGWLKPYENQWLAYPPHTARHFPPELAQLVGYRQHRPNLGNYEGQCPSILLKDRQDQPVGAIDALRPDQQALIDAHIAGQRG
ncbi:phytanoyl-CoA dioxygenase family protein [Sphingomonas psychrotolerans]|uniref:Phytanoyl-CoA dioxygenase family protein n=1 Tax=Sphingomonas psychrotolerans TaxID=1327635 RepID=A0ABU3NAX1_9SPHN|nr:phytanoyl-CoA dioxygenase family protein [Sphingomonas psychrotolerans]MDT8760550.1 phytanoyl-CoA dioxygenase family protein [Sphingomonas psychrotolerans]